MEAPNLVNTNKNKEKQSENVMLESSGISVAYSGIFWYPYQLSYKHQWCAKVTKDIKLHFSDFVKPNITYNHMHMNVFCIHLYILLFFRQHYEWLMVFIQ